MLEAPPKDAAVKRWSLAPVLRRWFAQVHAWHSALHRHLRPTPIVVMVADPVQRASLEFEMRCALRRLERVLGPATFASMTVVVQHSIHLEHAVAGCTHLGQLADGSPFALVRLALTLHGRDLTINEVLAVLAEQCIGLAVQQAGGMSVVVPVEWTSATTSPDSQPPPTRDPLAASHNGHLPLPSHSHP